MKPSTVWIVMCDYKCIDGVKREAALACFDKELADQEAASLNALARILAEGGEVLEHYRVVAVPFKGGLT